MRFHGGSFWVKHRVVDFSVNTNPLGIPLELEEAIHKCCIKDVYSTYPDYNYSELRESVANFHDIEPEYIIPSNGASEALSLSIISLKPKTLVIVAPTYGDYELICRALGVKCIYELMREEREKFILNTTKLITRIKRLNKVILIITNPNNPTGTLISEKEVMELAEELSDKGWILIDEAYAELSNYHGLLGVSNHNLIVIRSLTKVFSIPGLRIGFIYSVSKHLLHSIDALRPTWNVNAVVDCALRASLIRFKKELWSFIENSHSHIRYERDRLRNSLIRLRYKVYESRTNFLLLKHPWIDSLSLRDYLLKNHDILVRPAHTFKGLSNHYTRISVQSRKNNELLVKALEQVR